MKAKNWRTCHACQHERQDHVAFNFAAGVRSLCGTCYARGWRFTPKGEAVMPQLQDDWLKRVAEKRQRLQAELNAHMLRKLNGERWN